MAKRPYRGGRSSKQNGERQQAIMRTVTHFVEYEQGSEQSQKSAACIIKHAEFISILFFFDGYSASLHG